MPKMKKNADERTLAYELPYKMRAVDAKTQYVATLVNPVDRRLYNIIDAHGEVYVSAPLLLERYREGSSFPIYGEGYASTSETREIYYDGSEETFNRSHTPGGVTVKGKGLGLMLYCGLSLDALFRHGNAGIFSEESQRAAPATRWWKAQVQQEFAEESVDTSSGYGTIDVDIEVDEETILAEARGGSFGEELEGADDLEVTEGPEPSSVSVEFYVSGNTEIEFLPAAKVASEGIVVGWNTEDDDLDAMMQEHGVFPSAEVLVGLNLDTVRDMGIIRSVWGVIAEDEDITDSAKKKLIETIDSRFYASNRAEINELTGRQLTLPKELVANKKRKQVEHSAAWNQFYGDLAQSDSNLM